MRTAALVGALLVASACATEPAPPPPPPAVVAPVIPELPPPPPDTCGAREHQHLIGRHRREIPVPVYPSLQRVACTTCPITMDHDPRRLNFFYDADTGLIEEVKCG